jgi:aspartyl-tRNA(Asn)/glutamyl-tRNA(Gln) amidotransferase subunit C
MLSEKEVLHIATLARLKIPNEELPRISEQMSKLIIFFQSISKIDTAGVEPLITPHPTEQIWREDKVLQEITAEEITANAPSKTGRLFTVPPVI